ncbi:hypothetical protein ACI2K4_20465 [Micromonospora sp. NPDC050397]|uniref:hypothetical protein n=1 Tax=Micromonospora sp. NPDC050397 TaxID=3364279 RepID=UPI00384A8CF2
MNTIVGSRYAGQRTGEQSPAPVSRQVSRRQPERVLLALLVPVLALSTVACASPDRAPGRSTGGVEAAADPGTATASVPPTAAPGSGTDTGPTAAPAGQPGNPPGQPAAPGNAGPGVSTPPLRIVHFRITQKPTCPQGGSEFPVEAFPLILEWDVIGVTTIELSVDGPGRYGTYPARGTESFAFSCGGTPGSTENHTYKLTAKHGTYSDSRTVTGSATVYDLAGG